MGPNGSEPTIGQLVANASKDLSGLIRGEIALAKTELKKTAVAAGTGAGMFGAAAFLGVLVIILLSIAAAYGLTAAGLHPAIAFLIVAGAYLLIAAVLVFLGIRALKSAKGPQRTIETSKESVEVLKAIGKGD
ncbi:putative superfamily III holin-X [Kribbella antiqua]|uniref:Putative superfamily III holin-X n=2 Tax=Kribbella antiqua TaxID=2512217 RepID=A0A4R2IQT1_9ACTN|nr:putative superfamily III holin-X [Kribbella antiqua]